MAEIDLDFTTICSSLEVSTYRRILQRDTDHVRHVGVVSLQPAHVYRSVCSRSSLDRIILVPSIGTTVSDAGNVRFTTVEL